MTIGVKRGINLIMTLYGLVVVVVVIVDIHATDTKSCNTSHTVVHIK